MASSTMRLRVPGSPVTSGPISPIVRDVAHEMAARAHADAEPNAKKAARRNGNSERTEYRWRVEGPPPVRNCQLFLYRSADPFRHMATLMAAAHRRDIDDLSRAELIAAYHDVLEREKAAEAHDTRGDLDRSASWLDKAMASEQDAALDLRKAAIERRFAELRITREEVWR
jgi:hypothetical protein